MADELQKHRSCRYCVIHEYEDTIANPDSIWGTPRIRVKRTTSRCHRYPPMGGHFPYINPDNIGCGEHKPRKEMISDNQG